MNPDAKEFVPAHLLKRRQEEKEAKEAEKTLDDVTNKLDKVDLKSDSKENESTNSRVISTDTTKDSSREVQKNSTQSSDSSNDNLKPNSKDHSSSTSRLQNGHSTNENHGHGRQYASNNNQYEGDYPEEHQDLNEEDDRFLLNAGENICEFNGEQFIVPGEEHYENPSEASLAGYDFGNAEDNEDEDVCNAFEEFLGNLPDE